MFIHTRRLRRRKLHRSIIICLHCYWFFRSSRSEMPLKFGTKSYSKIGFAFTSTFAFTQCERILKFHRHQMNTKVNLFLWVSSVGVNTAIYFRNPFASHVIFAITIAWCEQCIRPGSIPTSCAREDRGEVEKFNESQCRVAPHARAHINQCTKWKCMLLVSRVHSDMHDPWDKGNNAK